MRTLDSKADAATSAGTTRADKKSVSTRNNSSLNFLIGLSAVLMIAFVIIELQVPTVERNFSMKNPFELEPESNLGAFTIVKPDPKPIPKTDPIQPKQSKPVVNNLKPPVVVDDNDPIVKADDDPATEPVTNKSDSNSKASDNQSSNTSITSVDTDTPRNMLSLTMAPLFPGCSERLDNDDRIDCFNKKMARFVQRRFDTSLSNEVPRHVDGKNNGAFYHRYFW